MKLIISLMIAMMALSAHADIGDKYSIFGKTNRVIFWGDDGNGQPTDGLIEIVGMTVFVENYLGNMVAVKAAIDIAQDAYGDPLMPRLDYIGSARRDKFLAGIVYDPADVVTTTDCLGLDFEVADVTQAPTVPVTKTCFKVRVKNLIVK